MTPNATLAGLGVLAAVLIAGLIWLVPRLRTSPEKRERLRRLQLNQQGRLVDATVMDVEDNLLHYAYVAGGVQYSTSQDVSAMRDLLPADPLRAVGAARVKYSVKNPANSIVLCEEWSGLKIQQEVPSDQPISTNL